MPTLSFILSALLVSSGAIYMYLSSTEKIEQTKVKVNESEKIKYLTKKVTLSLSTVSNNDINKSISVASLDNSKISELVARDNKINSKDMKLLDRFQKAMEKVVIKGGSENPTCQELAATGYVSINECKTLKNKKFNFYDATKNSLELPKESILAKDTIQSSRLEEKMIAAKSSNKLTKRRIVQYKEKIKNKKRLEKIVSKTVDTKYLTKIAAKYMKHAKKSKLNDIIKNKIEQKIKNINPTLKNGNNNTLAKIFEQYDKQENQYAKEVEQKLAKLKIRETQLQNQIKLINGDIEKTQMKIVSLEKGDDSKNSREPINSRKDMFGIAHGMIKNMIHGMKSSDFIELNRLKVHLSYQKRKLETIKKDMSKTQQEIIKLQNKRG